jgi:hypothetical protein
MAERTVFKINIRCDATLRVDEMAARAEVALGYSLRRGTKYGMPAWTGSLLGMRIVLDEWRGINESLIFRMFGQASDAPFVDAHLAGDTFVFADISQGVIDVLDLFDAGKWRLSSEPEIDAEFAWMQKVDPDV